MNEMNVVNIVLWSVQAFLALFFLAAGAPKILGRGIEKWTGFSELPRTQVVFTGFAEVLGAAGLVLPMATGVLPWLAPLAAVGLAIIVLMATGFHVRADERLAAVETGLWASITAAVAIGRWDLLASSADLRRGSWLLPWACWSLRPSSMSSSSGRVPRRAARPPTIARIAKGPGNQFPANGPGRPPPEPRTN